MNIEVLSQLNEALVINYVHDVSAHTFVLTTDFWDKALGSDRCFLELTFSGVDDFSRGRGLNEAVQRFFNSYSIDEQVGTFVVQSVQVEKGVETRSFELSLGDGFGSLKFSFESLSTARLDTIAKPYDGGWEYFDLATGRSIDFANPFQRRRDR